MISLLKKNNWRNKVDFINKTDLKPAGEIEFSRCATHGALYVAIELKNLQAH